METEVNVYVDIAGTPHLAGRLWARVRTGAKRPRDWVLRKPRPIAWHRPLSMRI